MAGHCCCWVANVLIIMNIVTGRSPTGYTSESTVGMASSGMPWETGASEGKYRYHPGGDPSQAPKDAPSAVNVVVIPDVTLPKVRFFLLPSLPPSLPPSLSS